MTPNLTGQDNLKSTLFNISHTACIGHILIFCALTDPSHLSFCIPGREVPQVGQRAEEERGRGGVGREEGGEEGAALDGLALGAGAVLVRSFE